MSIAVDQSNTGAILGYVSIGNAPIGQQFQPTVTPIDSVQLNLLPIIRDSMEPVDVAVKIHHANITGTVVATSNTVRVGNETSTSEGTITFTFTPVTVTLSDTYVFEIVGINGPGHAIKLGYTSGVYSHGSAIIKGSVDASKDFWFSESAG